MSKIRKDIISLTNTRDWINLIEQPKGKQYFEVDVNIETNPYIQIRMATKGTKPYPFCFYNVVNAGTSYITMYNGSSEYGEAHRGLPYFTNAVLGICIDYNNGFIEWYINGKLVSKYPAGKYCDIKNIKIFSCDTAEKIRIYKSTFKYSIPAGASAVGDSPSVTFYLQNNSLSKGSEHL